MEYIEGGDLLALAQAAPEGVDEFTLRPLVWDLAHAIADAKRLGSALLLVRCPRFPTFFGVRVLPPPPPCLPRGVWLTRLGGCLSCAPRWSRLCLCIPVPLLLFLAVLYCQWLWRVSPCAHPPSFPPSNRVVIVVRDTDPTGMTHSPSRLPPPQDLKPENVLLLPDGGAKVCDVGALVPVDSCGVPLTPVVAFTPGYAAPEVLACAGVPTRLSLRPAAVYALGALATAVLGNQRVSANLRDLLSRMTHPLPFGRPSIHRVLQHPWFHDA